MTPEQIQYIKDLVKKVKELELRIKAIEDKRKPEPQLKDKYKEEYTNFKSKRAVDKKTIAQ